MTRDKMLFTSDHDEPRRALQKFIAAEINPFVDEWEKADIFPAHELFKKLGDLGFLGLNKPTEFGGQGLDYSYAVMMAEELGAITCGGVPMAIGVQTDMATPALARFGSDEVRSEEHTSELQSHSDLVCRLLLEKKKKNKTII